MREIELKFQIPAEQLGAVRDAVRQSAPGIEPMTLQAAYFDTPDSLLARHKMALRVRREGADWVQTFKAAGQDAMTRVEDNQQASAPLDGRIRPDLTLHTAPAVRRALASPWGLRELDAQASADSLGLRAVYETRFERWSSTSAVPRGQVIVCVDIGEVRAGALHEPIQEMEIELGEGHPQAVIHAAREWVDRHGVWLDVQSKAYRGTRLAQADREGLPTPVAVPVPHAFDEAESPLDVRGLLSRALDAAAGNWSEVAAARPGFEAAIKAWHDTLSRLLTLARNQPALRHALSDDTWKTTQALTDTLAGLGCTSTSTSTSTDTSLWQEHARALARSPRVTHWGLDVLSALYA